MRHGDNPIPQLCWCHLATVAGLKDTEEGLGWERNEGNQGNRKIDGGGPREGQRERTRG
jgi:hypothetical protein